jgi:uncharacterized protein (TIGR02996 family)
MDLLSQHEAFLRAIFESPDDDTARLVYADFLHEQGDEDRAELIRVQCELARKSGQIEHRDRVWELATRERELLDRLRPPRGEWDDPEPVDYVRGFRPAAATFVVRRAVLGDPVAERWRVVRHEPELFGARTLSAEAGVRLRPEHVELLLSFPAAQWIATWNLSGQERNLPAETTFPTYIHSVLNEFVIEPVITNAGVEALAQHKGARRLSALDLRNNNLDNDAARALVKSPYLDNLKRLDLLEGNRFRGKVWQQVIERFGEDVVG